MLSNLIYDKIKLSGKSLVELPSRFAIKKYTEYQIILKNKGQEYNCALVDLYPTLEPITQYQDSVSKISAPSLFYFKGKWN